MRKNKTLSVTLAISLFGCFIFCRMAGADNVVTPEQIKNARFMSQAFLKANKQEQQRIAEETKVERERLKTIFVSLKSLETTSKNTGLPAKVTNGGKSKITQPSNISAIKKKANRQTKINAAKITVKNTRLSVMKEFEARARLKKKGDKHQLRKKKINDVLEEIENSLVDFSGPDGIDFTKLELLKGKLVIKKLKSEGLVDAPTAQVFNGKIKKISPPNKKIIERGR